jgi:plasmid maintenance system antidote protein VapI
MDWKPHVSQLIASGATVSGIAARIGVTPNAVRELMAGRTKQPRGMAAVYLSQLKPDDFATQQPH